MIVATPDWIEAVAKWTPSDPQKYSDNLKVFAFQKSDFF